MDFKCKKESEAPSGIGINMFSLVEIYSTKSLFSTFDAFDNASKLF